MEMQQMFVRLFKLLETEKHRKLQKTEIEELVDLMLLKRRLFPIKISELRALTDRNKPETCHHIKGRGYISRKYRGILFKVKDYAVVTHTFLDGHTEVKCMLCGKKWDLKDPEARQMVKQTTNFPSSSEIWLGKTKEDGPNNISQ